MKHIELDNLNYEFAKDFKNDQERRLSFNRLTETIFGLSLENWFQHGFWGDYYVPYSLLYDNEVISNVATNKIEFLFEGEKKTGIQIGTVMTDGRFRNKGLSKFLLQQVIKDWKGRVDFIYLFANDSVLDFYPKFDFEIVDEYVYSKSITSNDRTSPLKKLNVKDKGELSFILETVSNSIPVSKVSMVHNPSLVMFYCLSYKKDCIYYSEDFKAIIIADIQDNKLYLDDVFSTEPVEIDDLIQAVSNENIKEVVLGFTPFNDVTYNRSLLEQGDTLFVLKDNAGLFNNYQWRFPILSHA